MSEWRRCRGVVLATALCVISLFAAGCQGPALQRVLDAFAGGDMDSVQSLRDEISAGEDGAELAAFLVDLGRFLGGDRTMVDDGVTIGDPASLAGALEAEMAGRDESPWLRFAAGVLAVAKGAPDEAGAHFARVRQMAGKEEGTLLEAVEVAGQVAAGGELQQSLEATVNGTLRPAEGLYGYLLPLKGETIARGVLVSTLGEARFTADIDGWAYLFLASGESTEPCGWGLAVRGGHVLLERETYERVTKGGLPVVAEQGFDARLWDPLGRYVLLRFDEEEPRGYVVPVQIQWPDDTDAATRRLVPTPGVGFAGRMYWAEDYQGSRLGGMRIDERGRRVMFNTEGLRVELSSPSRITGAAASASMRRVPPSADGGNGGSTSD